MGVPILKSSDRDLALKFAFWCDDGSHATATVSVVVRTSLNLEIVRVPLQKACRFVMPPQNHLFVRQDNPVTAVIEEYESGFVLIRSDVRHERIFANCSHVRFEGFHRLSTEGAIVYEANVQMLIRMGCKILAQPRNREYERLVSRNPFGKIRDSSTFPS